RAFSVDTTLPSVAVTGGPAGPTNNNAPSFTFTSGLGATSTQCRIDTDAFAPCATPFNAPTLPDGGHTFDVRAFDAAGNFATASRGFTVDTVAPTVTITGGPSGATNDTTPTFTFTTSADATATSCSINGAPFASCISPFTSAVLAEGTY